VRGALRRACEKRQRPSYGQSSSSSQRRSAVRRRNKLANSCHWASGGTPKPPHKAWYVCSRARCKSIVPSFGRKDRDVNESSSCVNGVIGVRHCFRMKHARLSPRSHALV
jgi:hypothetical protein